MEKTNGHQMRIGAKKPPVTKRSSIITKAVKKAVRDFGYAFKKLATE